MMMMMATGEHGMEEVKAKRDDAADEAFRSAWIMLLATCFDANTWPLLLCRHSQ